MKKLIIFCLPVFSFYVINAADYIVSSPDGKIKVTLSLINQNLSYKVSKDGNDIVASSPLGIHTSIADFVNGLAYITSSTNSINETYNLPSGKKSSYTNNCSELTLRLSKNVAEVQLIFRVYNDGFAYRYNIPGSGAISINGETSGFSIANFDKSWGQKYRSDHSDYYPERNWAETVSIGTFSAPILVKNTTDSTWCLITEAANVGTYSVSKIVTGAQTGLFNLLQTGSISSALPLATPWRAVIIGDITTIVESVMIENLNPATLQTDLSWIKPGRASWDWGGEEGQPAVSVVLAKKYIDLASSMGWEYYMQDDGWDNASFNLQDVIDYGNTKGVGVLLWSHHNRFQNDENQIRPILSQWKNMGIKGIKVDFWEDDSQPMIQKYDKLLKVAEEQKLLVNLHGCTTPSGLRRTSPHLLTSEAVLGGEMYLFNTTMTPSNYNITLSMTRNVIGSMDYTPLDFANKTGVIKQFTTWSHQLALGVVFESGIQHMNDSPENYQYHISEELLKKLPAAWDDIKCLEAYPDQYTTIARRKGNEWYVGSLCNTARTLTLDLSFLNAGVTYFANIFKDGVCDSEIAFDQQQVSKGDTLSIPMRTNGGVSIYFSASPLKMPVITKYEAEANANQLNNATITQDPDGKCSNTQYVGFIGNGNTLVFNNVSAPSTGNYVMTLYYMTGANRDGYIRINNGISSNYTFTSSGSYNGKGLAMRSFVIGLNTGNNTIEFGNATGWSINIDRITVQSIQTNALPIVNITTPIQNQVFNVPANITITANSADSDGSVIKVEFYNGNIKLGESFSSPYTFNWANGMPGTYTITARSFDDKGAVGFSNAIKILVQATTGVEDIKNDEEFKVCPNPVAELLHIQTNASYKFSEIYNVAGLKVKESHLMTLNVSDLAPGLYLIKIYTPNNTPVNRVFIKK